MGPGGRFSLSEAAARGFTKTASHLLTSGVDVEKTSPAFKDATPVVVAAVMKNNRTVELLLGVSSTIKLST